jgi:hypothetical protein
MRRERARLEIVADYPDDLPPAAVTGIQNAPQLLVITEKSVGLINHERWPTGFNCPKCRGRQYVCSRERARHKLGNYVQQCRLTTAPFGRRDLPAENSRIVS